MGPAQPAGERREVVHPQQHQLPAVGRAGRAASYVADNRETFMRELRRSRATRMVERGTHSAPYAFVIPRDQRHAAEAARPGELLPQARQPRCTSRRVTSRDDDAEVVEDRGPTRRRASAAHDDSPACDAAAARRHRAARHGAARMARRCTVHTGDWIVRMDQPYTAPVRTVLAIQKYRADDPSPYDDTGWTLDRAAPRDDTSRSPTRRSSREPMRCSRADAASLARLPARARTLLVRAHRRLALGDAAVEGRRRGDASPIPRSQRTARPIPPARSSSSTTTRRRATRSKRSASRRRAAPAASDVRTHTISRAAHRAHAHVDRDAERRMGALRARPDGRAVHVHRPTRRCASRTRSTGSTSSCYRHVERSDGRRRERPADGRSGDSVEEDGAHAATSAVDETDDIRPGMGHDGAGGAATFRRARRAAHHRREQRRALPIDLGFTTADVDRSRRLGCSRAAACSARRSPTERVRSSTATTRRRSPCTSIRRRCSPSAPPERSQRTDGIDPAIVAARERQRARAIVSFAKNPARSAHLRPAGQRRRDGRKGGGRRRAARQGSRRACSGSGRCGARRRRAAFAMPLNAIANWNHLWPSSSKANENGAQRGAVPVLARSALGAGCDILPNAPSPIRTRRDQLARRSATKYDVAMLPWGATEAHNYHLPYGTDVMECDAVAAESARIAWERGARRDRAADGAVRRQHRSARHPALPQHESEHAGGTAGRPRAARSKGRGFASCVDSERSRRKRFPADDPRAAAAHGSVSLRAELVDLHGRATIISTSPAITQASSRRASCSTSRPISCCRSIRPATARSAGRRSRGCGKVGCGRRGRGRKSPPTLVPEIPNAATPEKGARFLADVSPRR